MKQPMACVYAVLFLLQLILPGVSAVAGDVEITRIDGHYLDRLINMVIEWQSVNPVVKARVTVGRETREILVDEYDNRRDPRGYHGTLSLQLPAEPQSSIPYTVQLEDDLRQLSSLLNGKITPTATATNFYQSSSPQSDDTWGKSSVRSSGISVYQQSGGQTGSVVNRLIEVVDRFDLAPSIDKIKTNILSPDTVSFSSRANDDKGLSEVRFKIYDRKGALVGIQQVTGLGKVWQGSSQTFTLGGGTFRVIAQAFDSGGNTSKEEGATFELTGKIIELATLQDVASPQSGQAQWPSNPQAYPGTATTYTQPNLQQPYVQQPNDTAGQQNYPPTGTYPPPAPATPSTSQPAAWW